MPSHMPSHGTSMSISIDFRPAPVPQLLPQFEFWSDPSLARTIQHKHQWWRKISVKHTRKKNSQYFEWRIAASGITRRSLKRSKVILKKRMDIEGSNSRRPIVTLITARHPLFFFLLLTSVSGRWWRTHRIPFANRVSPVSSLRGSPGTYTWSKQQTQALQKKRMYPNVTWCSANGYIPNMGEMSWRSSPQPRYSPPSTEERVWQYFPPPKKVAKTFLVQSNALTLPVVGTAKC